MPPRDIEQCMASGRYSINIDQVKVNRFGDWRLEA
jgi:hypothetical protein